MANEPSRLALLLGGLLPLIVMIVEHHRPPTGRPCATAGQPGDPQLRFKTSRKS